MDDVVATKTVNALIPEAEIGFAASFFADLTGGRATGAVLESAKKMMGGLWVGGTLTLHSRSLVFRPNRLNRLVHKGDYVVSIPLDAVRQVEVRHGFVTKIIDIRTGEGTLSVRCYGADAFAATIRDRVAAAGSAQPARAQPDRD